jgi:hypothetical protein
MRKLLLILLLFWTTVANAVEYRVMHLYSNLRIVIVDIECNIEGLHGERASAQRLDRLFIPGCWYKMEEHPGMIHIDWHNGDWSELPYQKFEKVDTQQ